jgi:hypothetical protein
MFLFSLGKQREATCFSANGEYTQNRLLLNLLICESYLHGFMDGRIMRALGRGALKPQILDLV